MDRWEIIERMFEDGKSYEEIGAAIGVSKQRVHQLINSNPVYRAELTAYRSLGTPEECAARVEVVRCGICKHKDRPMPHSAMKKWFCTVFGRFMDVDDFCSYGRRED